MKDNESIVLLMLYRESVAGLKNESVVGLKNVCWVTKSVCAFGRRRDPNFG